MLFLTDANIFVPMVEGLRKLGYDVFDAREEGLENSSDAKLFRLAQDQSRVLVTMDKDFSNILHYPPGDHCGIVVLKLHRLKVAEATKLFLEVMREIKTEHICGNLVIIDKAKTRIRREKLED